MSLYTIGDLHLSFGCSKGMDVFSGWKDYVNRIEKHWQEIVSPTDTVVIVGDISWAMKLEESTQDFEFIHKLNGKKIILKGNHDYWFVTRTKVMRFLEENGFDSIEILFNNAFEYEDIAICGTRGWINEKGEEADKKVLVREVGRLRASLESAVKWNKQPVAFMHYPPVYNVSECVDILQVLKEYNVKKCYYGHIHGSAANYAIDGLYKDISYRLVACDYTRFRPIKVI